MLLTLAHLLLTVGLIAIGPCLGALIADSVAIPEPWKTIFVSGFTLYLLLGLSWPIYRCLHLRPMGLPFCPHCGKRHGNYHIPAEAWPVAILFCHSCGQPVRLCLMRKPPADIAKDMPTLYLRWPEFLGIWRGMELGNTPPGSIEKAGGRLPSQSQLKRLLVTDEGLKLIESGREVFRFRWSEVSRSRPTSATYSRWI